MYQMTKREPKVKTQARNELHTARNYVYIIEKETSDVWFIVTTSLPRPTHLYLQLRLRVSNLFHRGLQLTAEAR